MGSPSLSRVLLEERRSLFLLLLLLAFLAPWISLDSERYARVLIHANVSLKNYDIKASTNNAPLIGSTPSKDFSLVVFASDLTPTVTYLTLSGQTLEPDRNYLNSFEIPDIPVAPIKKRIGSAGALLMQLDLKNGTLKLDNTCYRNIGSDNTPNPCEDAPCVAKTIR